MGKQWKHLLTLYFGAPKSLQMVTAAIKLKAVWPWKKSCDQTRQHIKKQRHHFTNKGQSSQSYAFSSSHVWMWEFDYKETWVPRNWFFWTVVLEKTLKSTLDCKEIQPVHPKGNQSWIFIGSTDAEAETPILWPGGGGDNRVWEGWMASPTRWTWVWVDSGSWWWTGKPGVLQFMGSQRVGHDWVTELMLNSADKKEQPGKWRNR